MNKHNTHVGIINSFFSEVAFGISANTILLLFQVFTFCQEHKHKPIHLITGLLALIHIVMLLTMAVIATDILGSQGFWDDFTCKLVISLYRLMRSLSICATCHLSVLQAITLSPRSFCLAKFKHKSLHHNLYCFLFLLVFYMSFGGRFLSSIVATPNVTSQIHVFVTKSCSVWLLNYFLQHLHFILVIFRDGSLIGLMALSSGYMVILLRKHKRQSQHLHSASLSPKASPERRATQTILLLVSVFVLTYTLDCIASSSRIMWNNYPVHRCVQMLMSTSYATVSPLVFIRAEQRSINVFKFMWGGQ